MTAALTREDVRDAYRLIFRRSPESEAVLDLHLNAHDGLRSLWTAFLKSPEFLDHFEVDHVHAPPQEVEVDCSAAALEQLFSRVRGTWSTLGDEQPFWSVLTQERFKTENISATRDEFFNTGNEQSGLIDRFAQRAGVEIPTTSCIELGCGVGRVTPHLASRFAKVIGLDISPGNLRLAHSRLGELRVENVELRQIRHLEDFAQVPPADFLLSFIVLQHNAPPAQKIILDALLRKVNAGGYCLFQTPARLPGYRFVLDDYLKTPAGELEMHAFPMPGVLRLLRDRGFALLEVLPDNWTGEPGSFTYFARKETAT